MLEEAYGGSPGSIGTRATVPESGEHLQYPHYINKTNDNMVVGVCINHKAWWGGGHKIAVQSTSLLKGDFMVLITGIPLTQAGDTKMGTVRGEVCVPISVSCVSLENILHTNKEPRISETG